MAWLLIDNSNSRTKLRLGDERGLLDWKEVLITGEITHGSMEQLVSGLDFSGVVIASVVPEKGRVIVDSFNKRFPVHELTYRSPLGYGFDLEKPEQIGNDRLSNVLAMKALYGAPGIAVDFGTAVTFSLLSNGGNFCGGVIAPGMEAMTGYMNCKTAQLPKIEAGMLDSVIGKTTVDAMKSGAVVGQRGMVREILRELIAEIGGEVKVVATGGGAEFTGAGMEEIDVIDPDLTIEGLRLLAARVFE
ncbi:type III pantothenate kinase [Luteolibacter sp. AS25]|uniref:type III pantothenate kinase n=1 Tax=Luteolibacter sp. AS25 TaxID=3135776 RepID=UPI00398B6245